MKHIKLFESFDRYEFGEIDKEQLEYTESYIEENRVDMKMSEIQTLIDIIKSKNIDELMCGYNSEKGHKKYFFAIIEYAHYNCEYTIYDLGDYCYSIISRHIHKYETIITNGWILDEFNEVVDKLENLAKEMIENLNKEKKIT